MALFRGLTSLKTREPLTFSQKHHDSNSIFVHGRDFFNRSLNILTLCTPLVGIPTLPSRKFRSSNRQQSTRQIATPPPFKNGRQAAELLSPRLVSTSHARHPQKLTFAMPTNEIVQKTTSPSLEFGRETGSTSTQSRGKKKYEYTDWVIAPISDIKTSLCGESGTLRKPSAAYQRKRCLPNGFYIP